MKWISIGDIHLQLHYNHGVETKNGNTRYLDLRNRIQTVAKTAIDQKIDFLVLLGDEFHSIGPNTPEELRSNFIEDLINPILQANIPIFAIVGNHNYNGKLQGLNSIAMMNPNFRLFYKTTKIKFRNETFVFIPWQGELPEVRENEIMFGHLEVTEGKIGAGERRYGSGISVARLRKYRGFYLAHFHKHQIFFQGKGRYVGSLIKIDFSEKDDQKGFTLSEILPNNDIDNRFIDLPDRNFLEWVVKEEEWTSHLTHGFMYRGEDPNHKLPFSKGDYRDSILKITFEGTSPWYMMFDQGVIKKIFKDKLLVSKILTHKKSRTAQKQLDIDEIKNHPDSIFLEDAITAYCKKIGREDAIDLGTQILRSLDE